MSDTFLERFEQRRTERLQADRSFVLAGETLTFKPSVAPEVGMRLQTVRQQYATQLLEAQRRLAAYEKDPGKPIEVDDLNLDAEALIAAADEQIMACLDDPGQKAWGRLRALDAEYPLSASEIGEIADYLLGRVTGIPTDAPVDSSNGRTKTVNGSKAPSSSRAKTPAVSR